MGSSNLKRDFRESLYHGKYRYKCTSRIAAINFCRLGTLSLDEIPDKLKQIQNSASKYYWHYPLNVDQLAKFMIWRIENAPKCKLSFGWDRLCVFSNDLSVYDSIKVFTDDVNITEAYIFASEAKTLYFKKKPKFSFRTYLNVGYVKAQTIADLADFLNRYETQNIIHFSPNLRRYCRNPSIDRIFSSRYGIDHMDEGMGMMLRLTFPELISDTYRMMKQPQY